MLHMLERIRSVEVKVNVSVCVVNRLQRRRMFVSQLFFSSFSLISFICAVWGVCRFHQRNKDMKARAGTHAAWVLCSLPFGLVFLREADPVSGLHAC